jgi:A/G-specific adenine glycosylase
MPGNSKQRELSRRILRWYSHHGRALPWRNTTDPYRILLSEVMLQQTQVSRVLEMYPRFLRTFPSIRALARAKQKDVVIAWKGMGYNNRAVRLHRLARVVAGRNGRSIPDRFEELVQLPGIGRYTANAILSSAFRQRVPIVDTNVRRLLSRLILKMHSVADAASEPLVWDVAQQLLPPRAAYAWNQALMDLGATVCTARMPRCAECPVASCCRSIGVMHRGVAKQTRREPSFDGTPNRIFRGRIIELLRRHNRSRFVERQRIRTEILKGKRQGDRWLDSILNSLVKDGLVVLRKSGSGRIEALSLA